MDKGIRDTESAEHQEIFAYADGVAVTVDSVKPTASSGN